MARIGVQAGDAVQYAHQHGILHRDIKLSNLLLDTAGTVWVTDFGLAKHTSPSSGETLTPHPSPSRRGVWGEGDENLTATGDVLGTLRYIAPEVFEGKTDERSDVYSLGLTLYELLALRPAFDESDRHQLVRQADFIGRLEQPRPQCPVHFHRGPDNGVGDVVQFHHFFPLRKSAQSAFPIKTQITRIIAD